MKAWQVHRHGDPVDVLTLEDIDEPSPGPGQVLLEVRAAGVNFADILLCQGTYQEHPPLPFTPGLELAGVVREVGSGVWSTGPLVGERFVALPALPHGAYADRAIAAITDCFPIPESLSDAAAAALTITYQTGWFGLVHRAALREGETLVVHAGASGVGSAAIQIGLACGARVIATAGGPDKVDVCRSLGAHDVIDYRAVDLVDALRAATDGRGADVIYDPVGGDVFDASRRCLAWEGRLVVVGFASGRIPDAPANHILVKNYSILGVHWGGYRSRNPHLIQTCHQQLMAWHEAGAISPLVMAERPLSEVPAALALLADRGAYGKVVITPG